MYRLLFVCIWLALSFSLTLSQDTSNRNETKPNLAGRWKLETKPSRDKVTTPGSNDETMLVIVHRGPEIKVIRQTLSGGEETKREFIYYSDARGERNYGVTIRNLPSITNNEIESETKWEGKKLRTFASVRKAFAGRFLNWKIISEWKLSTDNNTLTQTIRIVPEDSSERQISGTDRSRSLPGQVVIIGGPREFKYVFRRIL